MKPGFQATLIAAAAVAISIAAWPQASTTPTSESSPERLPHLYMPILHAHPVPPAPTPAMRMAPAAASASSPAPTASSWSIRLAASRKISPEPIRFLVNTHLHVDHTGGNANFVKMGAVLYPREELREELARPPARPPAAGTSAPSKIITTSATRWPHSTPATKDVNKAQKLPATLPRGGSFYGQNAWKMKLTAQPGLGALVILVHVGLLPLLLRHLLLSGALSLILLLLFVFGVHTWNTPFGD